MSKNDNKTENTAAAENTPKPEKASKPKKPKKPVNKRKLKYGSIATAITVVFIAVVVLLNIFTVTLTERYPLKLDLTANKAFEVSQETIDYLKDLSKSVEIDVMNDESSLKLGSTYDKQLVEVVKKYAQNSDKVNVEFINMDKNPNYVSKYNDIYKGEIKEGNIVVASGDKVKVLTANELYNTESYYYYNYITSSKAEQALTSAVMYVTDENPKKVGFLSVTSTSTTEASLSNFKSTLESNGYELEDIDLMSVEKIDDSIDMVVIPAPLNDFTTSMTDKLSDFLYNDGKLGKTVFYMANYDQNNTPNLDTFLSEWGIEIGNGYIYETDDNLRQVAPVYGMQNYVSSAVAQIVQPETDSEGETQYDDENTFTGLLSDESLPIIAPVSRPVNILFEKDNDKETTVILKSSDSCTVIPVDADSSYDISGSEKGSQNIMVKSSKSVYDDNDEKTSSNVIAAGSSFLVDYYMLTETAYNNGEFMINALNKITGKSNGITIVAKSLDSATITISESQTAVLTTIFVFVVPAVIVIIGIVVFVRRRNR